MLCWFIQPFGSLIVSEFCNNCFIDITLLSSGLFEFFVNFGGNGGIGGNFLGSVCIFTGIGSNTLTCFSGNGGNVESSDGSGIINFSSGISGNGLIGNGGNSIFEFLICGFGGNGGGLFEIIFGLGGIGGGIWVLV